jgi:hypothetical protein
VLVRDLGAESLGLLLGPRLDGEEEDEDRSERPVTEQRTPSPANLAASFATSEGITRWMSDPEAILGRESSNMTPHDIQVETVRDPSARRQSLLATYPGEWVAVSDDWQRVYAHGPSYLGVCESARRAGAVDPLLTRLL